MSIFALHLLSLLCFVIFVSKSFIFCYVLSFCFIFCYVLSFCFIFCYVLLSLLCFVIYNVLLSLLCFVIYYVLLSLLFVHLSLGIEELVVQCDVLQKAGLRVRVLPLEHGALLLSLLQLSLRCTHSFATLLQEAKSEDTSLQPLPRIKICILDTCK